MNPEDEELLEMTSGDDESAGEQPHLTGSSESDDINAEPGSDAPDAELKTTDEAEQSGAEEDAPDEDGAGEEGADEEGSPAVTFEGDRPIVAELQYQAPRQKPGAEEEEAAEETRFSSVAEARAVVEAFLFSSNEPLSVSRLSKLMGNLHPKTVRGLLLELQWEYENRGGALQVTEIAGGYQMCTRPFVAPWMFRLHKLKRRSPLSPATLETLAIIAYRQPITKGEIEGIRGVETGAPIRTLQELGLVEAGGRREVIGRPQLYNTTDQFLKVFGLKSIADLPSISELKSRFTEEQKLKPKTAAVTEQPVQSEEPEAHAESERDTETDMAEIDVDIEEVEVEVEVRGFEVDDDDIEMGTDVMESEIDVDEDFGSIDDEDQGGQA